MLQQQTKTTQSHPTANYKSNYNDALIRHDCTQIFIAAREEMINPVAKDYFKDMLNQLNIKPQRRK